VAGSTGASNVDECREIVRDMDNFARMHGYRDFAELAAKVEVKSVDDAVNLVKAILIYRECKKVLSEAGQG
jgi:uncharacterized protein YgfB (UPF0149 family)